MVYFKKTILFQGFGGGQTFSRVWGGGGGQTYSEGGPTFSGGGGGLNSKLYRNP